MSLKNQFPVESYDPYNELLPITNAIIQDGKTAINIINKELKLTKEQENIILSIGQVIELTEYFQENISARNATGNNNGIFNEFQELVAAFENITKMFKM